MCFNYKWYIFFKFFGNGFKFFFKPFDIKLYGPDNNNIINKNYRINLNNVGFNNNVSIINKTNRNNF